MESQWLPSDIILQILTKLPVKSLLRFRSVCRDWCTAISDPEFTHSIERRRRVVAKLRRRVVGIDEWGGVQILEEETVLDSIDDERATSIERLVKPWEEEEKHQHHHHQKELHLLGSCNGLLLVSLDTDIVLWNPSTRIYKKVLTYYSLENLDSIRDDTLMSGFCYDSTTDDYKIVIVRPPYGYIRAEHVVDFFTLKNKCRKAIVLRYRVSLQHYWEPVVNGHIHWLVRDDSFSFVLIYFDQIRDEFRELPIPDGNGYWILGLGELDGCLAILRRKMSTCSDSDNERLGGVVEVWRMKQYGVEESWSYLFKVSNFGEMNNSYYDGGLEACCYAKDGKVIMRVGRGEIVVYDPKQELYRRIIVRSDNFWISEVGTYVESLISPLDVIKTLRGNDRQINSKNTRIAKFHSNLRKGRELKCVRCN